MYSAHAGSCIGVGRGVIVPLDTQIPQKMEGRNGIFREGFEHLGISLGIPFPHVLKEEFRAVHHRRCLLIVRASPKIAVGSRNHSFSACLGVLLDDDDPGSAPRRKDGCRKTARATSDHQHIASEFPVCHFRPRFKR